MYVYIYIDIDILSDIIKELTTEKNHSIISVLCVENEYVEVNMYVCNTVKFHSGSKHCTVMIILKLYSNICYFSF